MKVKNKKTFFVGVILLFALLASYFIKIEIDSGANFVTETRLLGILIFYNLYLLSFYILIGVVLVVIGIWGLKFKIY